MNFWSEREEWSYKTFGPRVVRDGTGPLEHLKKELGEVVEAMWLFGMDPNPQTWAALLEEFVDCRFLLEDAVARTGFTEEEYEAASWAKLEKNKKRKWPDWKTLPTDAVIEHVK
jgi:hypothetical protein